MSKEIWKFTITPDILGIHMPVGAKILTIQEQEGMAHLWALVDTDAPTEVRYFDVFGTGHNLPYGIELSHLYIGTFQIPSKSFVFHVFENLRK